MKIVKLLFIGFYLLLVAPVSAQKVSAFLSDSSILLGEQVTLTLQINSPKEKVVFPELKDSIVSKVEILKLGKIDTSADELGFIFSQKISITSFDSGLYVLPSMSFKIGDSTLFSSPIVLAVEPPKIDLAKNIKDIAPILEAPLTWKEILAMAGKWLAIILILALLIWLGYKWYHKYQLNKQIPVPVVPDRPFMEVLWEKIAALENAKLWQTGKIKDHHSQASELLRSYLEYRYRIKALENTTSQILQQLRAMQLEKASYEKIKQSLLFADQVKFAKAQGIQEQHERVLQDLKEIIKQNIEQ